MKKYYPECSIEGDSLYLDARSIIQTRPYKNRDLNYLVYRFIMKDNAEAAIEKELIPKKALIDKNSLLNKDDAIHANEISGFSKKPISNKKKVAPKTARHKAQSVSTRSFSYAQIEKVWKGIENKEVGKIPEKETE